MRPFEEWVVWKHRDKTIREQEWRKEEMGAPGTCWVGHYSEKFRYDYVLPCHVEDELRAEYEEYVKECKEEERLRNRRGMM